MRQFEAHAREKCRQEEEVKRRRFLENRTEFWLMSEYYKGVILHRKQEQHSYAELLGQMDLPVYKGKILYLQYATRTWLPDCNRSFEELEKKEQQLQEAIANAVCRMSGWSFNDSGGNTMVLLPLESADDAVLCMREIHQVLVRKLGGNEQIRAVCEVVEQFDHLADSYENAEKLLLLPPRCTKHYIASDASWYSETKAIAQPSEKMRQTAKKMYQLVKSVQGTVVCGAYEQGVESCKELYRLIREVCPEQSEKEAFCHLTLICTRGLEIWGEELCASLKNMQETSNKRAKDDWQKVCHDLVRLLIFAYGESDHTEVQEKLGSKIVSMAKEYILQNYNRSFGLTDVAEYTGVSPNYLSTMFTKETGDSCMRYAMKVRMGVAARRLLTEPQLRIEDLAQQTGYVDKKHFLHVFKKYFHMTTTEFKKGEAMLPLDMMREE